MAQQRIGIITGNGLPKSLDELFEKQRDTTNTSNQMGRILGYKIATRKDTEFFLMRRHGAEDERGNPKFSPAMMVKENMYEALVWELHKNKVDVVYAFSRAGALDPLPLVSNGAAIVPDMYSRGFATASHSFGTDAKTTHTTMKIPFDEKLRQRLIAAGTAAGVSVTDNGLYIQNGGDSFEAPAENEALKVIHVARKDKVVGMTVVPEVILCTQMQIPYAVMNFVVNPAESDDPEVEVSHKVTNEEMARGDEFVTKIYEQLIKSYD